MIVIRDLNLKFKEQELFNNLCLEIGGAGLYLLEGDNGVGKSTLLNVIGGFLKTSGQSHNDHLQSVSYVFQNAYLVEYLTIKEHFEMFNIDVEILKVFDLLNISSKYCKEISVGQRVRVAVILALFSNNEVVLLDEPFANLDDKNQRKMEKLILKKAKEKIIIVVTHKSFTHKALYMRLKIENNKLKVVQKVERRFLISKKEKPYLLKQDYKLKEFRFHFKNNMKVYCLVILGMILISSLLILQKTIQNFLVDDKNNALEYNKYYFSKCEKVYENEVLINKCTNPYLEELEDYDYKFNYDYLLSYLYKRNDLLVINEKNVNLSEGRYPTLFNEVIGGSDYKLGEIITLDTRQLVVGEQIDVYECQLELKVVGIANKLHFFNQNNLYFDYDLLDEFFKNQILENNEIDLVTYYESLEIDNYKYLSFTLSNNHYLVNKVQEFYAGLEIVERELRQTISYFIAFIVGTFAFYFYKFNRVRVINKSSEAGFFFAHSFRKSSIIMQFLFFDILFFTFILFITCCLSLLKINITYVILYDLLIFMLEVVLVVKHLNKRIVYALSRMEVC